MSDLARKKRPLRLMDNVLPGNQDFSGNGDKYSLDWWENNRLNDDDKKFVENQEAKMQQADPAVPIASKITDELLDGLAAAPRIRQKIKTSMVAGQLQSNIQIKINVPENCRIIKIVTGTTSSVVSVSINPIANITNSLQTNLDYGFNFWYAEPQTPTYIPIHGQISEIYALTLAPSASLYVTFICGDFDTDEFMMNH